MYGPALVQAFRTFKTIWDPTGRMNAGNIVDPYPITSDLRPGMAGQPGKRVVASCQLLDSLPNGIKRERSR